MFTKQLIISITRFLSITANVFSSHDQHLSVVLVNMHDLLAFAHRYLISYITGHILVDIIEGSHNIA